MSSTKTKKSAPKRAARRGRPPKAGAETPNLPGVRVIKRYGNRRLYDHTLSRAVTMEEIEAGVKAGEQIRVFDEDGKDITKRVFVQIILEGQNRLQLELLPVDFLRQLISLQNKNAAGWLEQYLTAGAEWMNRQMSSLQTLTRPPPPPDEILNMDAMFAWPKAAPPPGAPEESDDSKLQREVADLQRRLRDITKQVGRRRR